LDARKIQRLRLGLNPRTRTLKLISYSKGFVSSSHTKFYQTYNRVTVGQTDMCQRNVLVFCFVRTGLETWPFVNMRDLLLPPRFEWNLRSSRVLHCLDL
jgi:hypothetical protein